ncbi:YesL family protein [Lederbergia wuyishanensis]|uniref:Membrane protein YesL n=1 Tax=Lederbergia wuyishanensis TaxID=1347903 RepID=A0ABU0D8Z7_9BACI|nr:YesL family protein [Lederbergia wuyishanensis]MCJ8007536.1 YesL family protein [Lederbergia wuyishanensis]MDQ0344884.1 putative membrane protein YesL [Lederbergia wuyishanensis]
MDGKQIITSLDRIMHWVMRFAILNVLWFLFSLLGLFVAGIFPATVAALGVARKWITGNDEIHIYKTFREIYKQEFKSANLIGWMLMIGGLVLYINYRVMVNATNEIMFIIPFAFYLLVFFFTITALWSFPLMAHYESKWHIHIKNAFIIGISKIHYTLLLGMVFFIVFYISLEIPAFILFFSVGIGLAGCMWVAMQVFKQLDKN